jgi:DNA mismatch repair protein MLH3
MELRIPAITTSLAFTPDLQKDPTHSCHGYEHPHYDDSQYLRPGGSNVHLGISSHTFSKSDLLHAQVISQVDRKFIACLMNDQTDECDPRGMALVLIDQHAADERVRVERFLKELCQGFPYLAHHNDVAAVGIRTKQLSPPIPVLLTRREALRLGDSKDIQRAFEAWGVHFANICTETIEEENNSDGYTQVFVNNIPSVVSEKVKECQIRFSNLTHSYLCSCCKEMNYGT